MSQKNDAFWNSVGTRLAVIAALLTAGSFLFSASFSELGLPLINFILFLGGLSCSFASVSMVIINIDEIFETEFYKSMEKATENVSFSRKRIIVFLLFCGACIAIGFYASTTENAWNGSAIIVAVLIAIGFFASLVFASLIMKAVFTKSITRLSIVYIVAFGALATALMPYAESLKSDSLEKESLIFSWCQVVVQDNVSDKNKLLQGCLDAAAKRLNHLSN